MEQGKSSKARAARQRPDLLLIFGAHSERLQSRYPVLLHAHMIRKPLQMCVGKVGIVH